MDHTLEDGAYIFTQQSCNATSQKVSLLLYFPPLFMEILTANSSELVLYWGNIYVILPQFLNINWNRIGEPSILYSVYK